jgi:methionyl-tRNA formyltransferase
MIKKTDGEVSFSAENAQEIYDKFRAFQPWPGVYTYVGDKKL